MDNERKKKIEQFWIAKASLTSALLILSFVALMFILTDRMPVWLPWVFLASAVAMIFFDLRKGVCPFCGKLIKTAKVTREHRFRFCPYCGESLVVEK